MPFDVAELCPKAGTPGLNGFVVAKKAELVKKKFELGGKAGHGSVLLRDSKEFGEMIGSGGSSPEAVGHAVGFAGGGLARILSVARAIPQVLEWHMLREFLPVLRCRGSLPRPACRALMAASREYRRHVFPGSGVVRVVSGAGQFMARRAGHVAATNDVVSTGGIAVCES